MLSKMNIFKKYELIPKNHLDEVEKILVELDMNYQTIVGTNEEEKRKNSTVYKNSYEELKLKLK